MPRRARACRRLAAAPLLAALAVAGLAASAARASESLQDDLQTAQFAAELEARGRALRDPYLLIAAVRLRTAAGLTDANGATLEEAEAFAGESPVAKAAIASARLDAGHAPGDASRAPFSPMISEQTPLEPVRAAGVMQRTLRVGPGRIALAIIVRGEAVEAVRQKLLVQVLDRDGRPVVTAPPAPIGYLNWTNATGGPYVVVVRNRASHDGQVQMYYIHDK